MDFESLFSGGLQQDLDPALQPQNTFRGNKNMRLVSLGGNSFSLESAKGTSLAFSIPVGHLPIGFTTFEDELIVFSTNASSGSTQSAIGVVTFVDSVATYLAVYSNSGLNFGWSTPIRKAICIKENANTVRLYWTDGFNPPRCINLADSGIGSLSVGSLNFTPLKTTGEVQFLYQTNNGELKNGVYQYIYRLRTKAGVVSCWSYLSREVFVSDQLMGSDDNHDYQKRQGGSSANTSPYSNTIQITNIDSGFDFIDVAAVYSPDLNVSGLGIMFSSVARTGDTMQFTHFGNENLALFTMSDLVATTTGLLTVGDIEVNKNRMFIADISTTGDPGTAIAPATISVEQYLFPSDEAPGVPSNGGQVIGGPNPTQLVGHKKAVASIAHGDIIANGRYTVVGGVISYDSVQYVAGSVFTGVHSAADWSVVAGSPVITACIKIVKYVVPSGNIVPGKTYLVDGYDSSGDGTVTYNGDTFTKGQPIVGVSGHLTYTSTHSGGMVVADVIPILDDYLDMKGVAMSNYLRSNWRGEKYRYGVVIFDLVGNPMFVRWIGDITMPQLYDGLSGSSYSGLKFNPRLMEQNVSADTSNGSLSLRSLGVNISNLDLTDVIDVISGFSVVIAPRDGQIIAQGMTFTCRADTGPFASTVKPMANLQEYAETKTRKSNYWGFYAPDFLFPNMAPTSKWVSGDKAQLVDFYDHNGSWDVTTSLGSEDTDQYHTCHKMYEQSGTVSNPIGSSAGQRGYSDFLLNVIQVASADSIGPGWNPVDPSVGFDRLGEIEGAFTGAGGKTSACSNHDVLYSKNDPGFFSHNDSGGGDTQKAIVNIIRPKGNLYGGDSDNAKANTQYMYAGHYQKIDAGVRADILSGGRYILNGIQVFGGDCFVTIFDIQRQLKYGTTEDNSNATYSHSIIFPVESNVNTCLREGAHVAKNRSYELIDNINVGGISRDYSGSTLTGEVFTYENAFSQNRSPLLYPALPVNFKSNTGSEVMIRFTTEKRNGELVDTFRQYLPDNFKEVEGRYGRIENLVVDADMLYYLQNHAVGYLPVNERAVAYTNVPGQTQLGIGGVLDRFDQISNYFGCQHHFSLTKAANGFVWFDMRRRALCSMRITSDGVSNVSVAKGMRSLFYENLDSGPILVNDNPIIGQGISAFFDPSFNEVVMVFNNAANGCFAILYNFDLDRFVSQDFSLKSIIGSSVSDKLCVGMSISPILAADIDYVVGDRVTQYATLSNPTNYICILGYNSGATPGNPSDDTTHWSPVSVSNEIHYMNTGDVCKFFGVVEDCYVELIINPDRKEKIFDNLELIGNDVQIEPFSSYEFANSFQSGEDDNIEDGTNIEYRLINRKWFSSIPFDDNDQRFTDAWLKVRLLKKNGFNGSLFSSKNVITKIVSLITTYRYTR